MGTFQLLYRDDNDCWELSRYCLEMTMFYRNSPDIVYRWQWSLVTPQALSTNDNGPCELSRYCLEMTMVHSNTRDIVQRWQLFMVIIQVLSRDDNGHWQQHKHYLEMTTVYEMVFGNTMVLGNFPDIVYRWQWFLVTPHTLSRNDNGPRKISRYYLQMTMVLSNTTHII